MLELYGERAELADGQRILELGCGWGSLTLWMAERYPNATIVAVSNSNQQREYIETQCRQRSLRNVRVITQDVNRLELDAEQFDRCVSVEMFEHMRNYDILLEPHRGLAAAGRQAVRAHLCAQNLDVSVRDGRRGQLDGPAFLHRRPDALPPTRCSGSSAT